MIGGHLGFLHGLVFAGATPVFVFISDNRGVGKPEGEEPACLVSFQDSCRGLFDVFTVFELSVVELTFQVLESRTGLGDAALKPFSFDAPQVVVKKDDHAKTVILFLVADGHRDLEAAIDPIFVWDQHLLIMTGKGRIKNVRIGLVHGGRGQEKASIVAKAGHILLADQLAVSHKDKVPFAQKIDEILPLLDIGGHIGRVAAVGLLEQRKTAVRAHGHGQDQLLEILPMLFTVTEGDLDAFVTFVATSLPVIGDRGGVVVTRIGPNIERIDHVSCQLKLQVADTMIVQRIKGVCQSVVEILPGLDTGKDHLEHRALTGQLTDAVKLHDLEQNARDHGNGCLAVGQDLSPRVGGNVLVDDLGDGAFFKVVPQDRGKADSLSLDIIDDSGCRTGQCILGSPPLVPEVLHFLIIKI